MSHTVSATKARAALRTSARASAHILILGLAAWAALRLLGVAWPALWPVAVALLLTTLTWPPVRFLRRHRWRPAPAAALITALFVVLAVTAAIVIVAPVASHAGELTNGVASGINTMWNWVQGPPLNISNSQLNSALDTLVKRIQSSAGSIATTTISVGGTVVNGFVTAVVAMFLMFFFLKDGPRFLPWLARQLPGRLARDLPAIADRSWATLGAFVRAQAVVGLLDAVLIGVGIWIVGVPMALPLAALTFVAAFVPVVGALFAGFVAVLIALVYNGVTDALTVLAVIVVVQQLEGHVLQPMVQGRGLGLHAAVVILSVLLGSSLYDIVGALLAVPLAAIIGTVWAYVREQLSDSAAPPPPAAAR
ncbi:putative integral membrane protein [Actinoplanes missouriensis 431]|uniref:Putative integral membrane protein n=1 Tax=Actinoplanes missouriensis (strain ATCC 14538 / DSM 43046 / CBS 188.64 / JCM 3121 / NBRC 102363 / NCIMB 12654 / NRRL B-3342 / UNCC 431) TaxID=512565 RepID=I0H4H5_ACTM4|nr:AI-2E family transporter [Actinoplanes missouriensis]BAL87912.1 putative integral membrane protein [Actinoplanes missouriensis 431]